MFKAIATTVLLLAFLGLVFVSPAAGQDIPLGRENVKVTAPAYSPYAGRNFPTKVLWVDTHLHTANSLDARALGVTLTPADAYRFARGEEVTATHGERVKLSRPLDFLVVSDHSDAMGAMNEIVAGNPDLMRDPLLRDWNERLSQGGETAFNTAIEVVETFAGVIGDPLLTAHWVDPDQRSTYYVSVIVIPKPRWTAYHAKFYGTDIPEEVLMTVQDRAYTSPIWYTP